MMVRMLVMVLLGGITACDDSLPPVTVDGGPIEDGAADTSKDVETGGGCRSSSDDCDEGEYCEKKSCDEEGVCSAKPGGCQEDCPGVCGCDGKFYCNGCMAAHAGWSTSEEDRSCLEDPPGCATNADCGESEYCHHENDCGLLGVLGRCADRPPGCDLLHAPVCGCNHKTYSNDCMAHNEGVNVKHPGECSECTTDADCVEGKQWCEGGTCMACSNDGLLCTMACPNGWIMYERNGCFPCACAPKNECTRNADCGAGKQCYAGAFCWDWCPIDDPRCCYGNLCFDAGCTSAPGVGCVARGCPSSGWQCSVDIDDGCASSSCDCSGGEWICTDDCSGGVCVLP